MSNVSKFLTALVLGLTLSLSLLLTSSFAHTANQKTATHVAAVNTHLITHCGGYGWGGYGWGGWGGWGGCDWGCGGWGW